MITQQEIQGNWNQLKGQIREKWGQISEDELTEAKGNVDRLIGTIQQRTGESRARVEAFLDAALESGASRLNEAAEHLRSCATDFSRKSQEQYEQAQQAIASGLDYATDTVRRRPAESIAVCFGAGLIAGAVLGLILQRKA